VGQSKGNICLDFYFLNIYFHNTIKIKYLRVFMFVVANLVEAIARILDVGLTLYMWIVIIRALLSWVNPDPYNPIVRFLYRATEPVLRPIRRLIPMGNIGIDISPVIVILVIILLQNFVVRSMIEFAFRLKT